MEQNDINTPDAKGVKKKFTIKKIILIYFIVLLSLIFSFLIYVRHSLVTYENNQIETYMNNLISTLSSASKKGKLGNHVDISKISVSMLEKDSMTVNEGYSNLFKNAKITHKKISEDKDKKTVSYEILADNKKIFEVVIEKGKEVHRMGLLTFNILKTKDIKANSDRGIYYYDIEVPSNFKVKINGKELTDEYKKNEVAFEEFKRMEYITIPKIVTYQVNNLINKPSITITNNNNEEINYKEENGKISTTSFYQTDNKEEAMAKLAAPFDALDLTRKWSLFLTNDLGGTRRGLDKLAVNLVKDSYMWDMAYNWATGVDITFVSKHTLKNPTFTNESESRYIVYNENAFSCLVHLEKNMTVNGQTKVDTINDRLYFIYLDDKNDGINNPTWRLVDMKNVIVE